MTKLTRKVCEKAKFEGETDETKVGLAGRAVGCRTEGVLGSGRGGRGRTK